MPKVKNGDTVKVNYTGRLDDGTVFDTSEDREPLQFTVGANHVIPGFESGVLDMSPGDEKTINIPMDEAYGPHRTEMVAIMGKDQFPPEMDIQIGQNLEIKQDDDKVFLVAVTEINEDSITIDANHPLAGKDLTFDLQLVEIV